ncbi:MAG TPA: TIGR03435 family protein [Bryobacteraceae bacterium]|nr:TIGR03435 family protein [Bryobacteraceae bacterium]
MKFKSSTLAFAALALQAASFDVASVKPANPNAVGSNTDSDPGRITMQNVTLKRCIMRAYEVPDIQITGGPKWLDTSRYDIEARAGYAAQYAELNQMLQTLLAERFHLKLHHETRSLQGYAIVIAKDGLKMKPSAPGTRGHTNDNPGSVVSTATSISRLALKLSVLLKVPVVDETGVSGSFDFALHWIPDEAADPTAGPSLFTAIQEQLGLRLEGRKVPTDMLVVDSAEPPSAN